MLLRKPAAPKPKSPVDSKIWDGNLERRGTVLEVWEALVGPLPLIGQEQGVPRRLAIRIVVFRKTTSAAFQMKTAPEGISPSL